MLINENNYDEPKVTVIVTVYNSEKYLDKCLNSLEKQTLDKKDLEVLIVNDGSRDGSLKIIDKYIRHNKNFRLISQENKGLFAARKTGLENAKGMFIGWVDSDDFVDDSMYEVLLNTAQTYQSDLVYCNYEFYPQKIKTKEKWFRKYTGKKNVNYVERNSQPWNKLVSKSLLERLNIKELFEKCFDESYIKCLLYANNPVSLNTSLYHYRVGTDTMSSSYKSVDHYKKFIDSSRELRKAMNSLCKKSNYWKQYFDFRILYYQLLTLIIAANSGDKETFYNLKMKLVNLKKNIYFKNIMIENYGFIKYWVMVKIIPINYYLSKSICKVAFS